MQGRLLYVVARGRPALYERFKRQLAGERVEVILDRRGDDRRAADDAGASSDAPRDERRALDLESDLASVGWAVVALDAPPRPDPDRIHLEPGDRVVMKHYNPTLPQALVARCGIVLGVARRRATVQFDDEERARVVDIMDMAHVAVPRSRRRRPRA
jgi:hypothetical protein